MRIYLLIIGMMIVTYIPRAIPAVLVDRIKCGKRMEEFLSLIPYTAMTALIFPGVLSVDTNHMSVGTIGALAAILLSWVRLPITMVVIGAVLVDIIVYMVLG
ncbi:branched-chain amino acid transporter [Clostridium polyendosporum]|uniref:Branched-chain amino acid transporter n=1 Tax=Clostridium polyendosporum TaxID=69208 RepID=A0A919VFF8_9CLOT|nr:AzlD domain-containing protein [Clostridium polyendosporum]GIM28380.1 branched-chain amino acid transporter [Clostridium polyendosporum]